MQHLPGSTLCLGRGIFGTEKGSCSERLTFRRLPHLRVYDGMVLPHLLDGYMMHHAIGHAAAVIVGVGVGIGAVVVAGTVSGHHADHLCKCFLAGRKLWNPVVWVRSSDVFTY